MDEVKFRFVLVIAFILTSAILVLQANQLYIFDSGKRSASISAVNSMEKEGLVSNSLVSISRFADATALNVSISRANAVLNSSLPDDYCLEAYAGKNDILFRDPFIAHNADKPLIPASTNKYITAAIVLSVFKADDTLDTSLIADSNSATIKKAYIKTSADPSFVTSMTPPARRPSYLSPANIHTFKEFAEKSYNVGVRSISNLVVDGKWFELPPVESGWADDKSEVGQISAFNIDEGFNGDDLASDPSEHAADVLKETFLEKGITIGTITYSTIPDELTTPEKTIAKTTSAKIKTLVSDMLKTSDNVYAEQLLAAAAHKRIGVVSKDTLEDFVNDVLSDIGINSVGYVFENGSGYSTKAKATCSLENDVIITMGKKGIDLPSLASISGQDGTLKTRFEDSADIVTAKTGTMDNVSALSGRIGDKALFSFIVNSQFTFDGGRELQDNVVSILSSFPFVDTPEFPDTFGS